MTNKSNSRQSGVHGRDEKNSRPSEKKSSVGITTGQKTSVGTNAKRKTSIRTKPLSDLEIIQKNFDVLITVCSSYGFELNGYSTEKTLKHYQKILGFYDGNWMKMFKDKLAAFRAYYKQQDLPSSPCPSNIFGAQFLFGGRAHRWMRLLMRKDPISFDSFIISICQSKKGMHRPDQSMVEKSMKDTFNTLTGPKVLPSNSTLCLRDWGDIVNNSSLIDDYLCHDSCKKQLRRTVIEVFGDKEYSNWDRLKPFFPSANSNYNNTKVCYGMVGELLEQIHGVGEALVVNPPKPQFDTLRSKEPLINNVNVYTDSHRQVPIYDETPLHRQYRKLYELCLREALVEVPNTSLVGLQESLKVRVISKGPPYHYFVLKPLQKFLWKTMKEHKMFRLIGKTVTAEDVQDVVGTQLSKEEYFLSVDYSDATNQIRSWASEIVVQQLSDTLKLSDDERRLFLESMTQHIMSRPKNKKEEKEFEKLLAAYYEAENLEEASKLLADQELAQQNGQLMGSIVSFPILCLINATILRWTQEVTYQQVKTLDNCHCTVNGDDGLLKTTKVGREIWGKISPFMGLNPSLGKVFFSREFLDINSTNFTYNPEGYECILDEHNKPIKKLRLGEKLTASQLQSIRNDADKLLEGRWNKGKTALQFHEVLGVDYKMSHFRATPFINCGLLLGVPRSIVKVSNADTSSKEKSFGSVCRELIANAPESTRPAVMRKFLNVNKEFLTQCTTYGVPWYVPENYGGLGLPIFGDFRPSELDLSLMRKFQRNPHIYKLPSRPNFSWRVWDYVSLRMKEMNAGLQNQLFCQEYGASSEEDHTVSTLEGMLAIESLFTIGPDILPLPEKEIKGQKGKVTKKDKSYLPVLGKFNKKLLKDKTVPLPEPFNLRDPFPGVPQQLPQRVIMIAHENISSFSQVAELRRSQ